MSSSLLYTLDGFQDTVFILNSTARALRILYSSPSLPSGPHTLVMTLTAANTSLSVQGMSIIVDSDAAATTVAHRIAEAQRWKIATIVGGTIGGLFMIIFLVCTITYHRRRERTRAAGKLNVYLLQASDRKNSSCQLARLALGPMTVSLPMSKEAFTTRNYSNYGLSFSSAPPSTDSLPLPPKVQTPIHRTHNPPTNAALTTGSMTVPTIFCAESSH